MRYFYTLLLYGLMPFALLRLWWKSRHNPAYRQRIGERFAYRLPETQTIRPLWIHAVSVGEFLAIKPLLIELLSRHPQLPLWITSTTPTGSAQIQQFMHDYPTRIQHSYFPYDLPSILRRFMAHVRPRGIVLMETEIWPNLLTIADGEQIPVVLTNARLSAKSLRGYAKYARALFIEPLASLRINAQTRDDARRFRTLGAKPAHVSVTPNIKYHHRQVELPAWTDDLTQQLVGFDVVWLAASTHSGEDEIIINAHKLLQISMPNSLLIIAPRHPERRHEVISLIQHANYTPKLRSQAARVETSDDIYMVDTLGELNSFFALVNTAFIGGSLINHGGHNPLEAIHAGVPVCFGPSMFNFKAIAAELLSHPFAITVVDAQSLCDAVLRFARVDVQDSISAFNRQRTEVLNEHYEYIRTHIALSKDDFMH